MNGAKVFDATLSLKREPISSAALTRLPGLGHLAHEEAPRRIAALILALARAHRRAGRPGAPTGDAR
jgi:pimeloyl-ACP methyl ester carboxylesterase